MIWWSPKGQKREVKSEDYKDYKTWFLRSEFSLFYLVLLQSAHLPLKTFWPAFIALIVGGKALLLHIMTSPHGFIFREYAQFSKTLRCAIFSV